MDEPIDENYIPLGINAGGINSPSRCAAKQVIAKKGHLTICKQNLACLTCAPKKARTNSSEIIKRLRAILAVLSKDSEFTMQSLNEF